MSIHDYILNKKGEVRRDFAGNIILSALYFEPLWFFSTDEEWKIYDVSAVSSSTISHGRWVVDTTPTSYKVTLDGTTATLTISCDVISQSRQLDNKTNLKTDNDKNNTK